MMTGVTLRVDIDEDGVSSALSDLIERGDDLTPLMDSIGMGLEASITERFNETSVAPSGAPWTPSIAAREEGRRTLINSGNLRDSITHRAGRDEVEVGSNVIYAAIHQFGGTIKAKTSKGLRFKIGDRFVTKNEVTIPARPFLGVSESDRDLIREEVVAFLGEAFQ
jgi:phage virion morphogenesis protein